MTIDRMATVGRCMFFMFRWFKMLCIAQSTVLTSGAML